MLGSAWVGPYRFMTFLMSIGRFFRPTFAEASRHYQEVRGNRREFAFRGHIFEAVEYVSRANHGLEGSPDLTQALGFYEAECEEGHLDPWGHGRRKIRATLVRWGAEDPAPSRATAALQRVEGIRVS